MHRILCFCVLKQSDMVQMSRKAISPNCHWGFAERMFANAIRRIELSATVHEGLFASCLESLCSVNPDSDLPHHMKARYQELMQELGCRFGHYDTESVGKAVSSVDEDTALRVADEIRRQSRLLHH